MQRCKMRNQTALGWLIIIWGNDQSCIGPDLFRVLNETNCLYRIVRTGTRNHWNPACRSLDNSLDNRLVLGMGQSWAFASRTDGNKPMRPFTDVPFHQLLEGFQIQSAVTKRRDEGRHRTFKHSHAPLLRVAGRGPETNFAYARNVSCNCTIRAYAYSVYPRADQKCKR